MLKKLCLKRKKFLHNGQVHAIISRGFDIDASHLTKIS